MPWLLIKKHRDHYISTKDVTEEAPRSVVTRRLLAGIAKDEGGDIEKAAKGDPPGMGRYTTKAKSESGRKRKYLSGD
jgi:hypothetical protein